MKMSKGIGLAQGRRKKFSGSQRIPRANQNLRDLDEPTSCIDMGLSYSIAHPEERWWTR
jgi:hypothetical protein